MGAHFRNIASRRLRERSAVRDVDDPQVRVHYPGSAVLELDLRLDVLRGLAGVESVDQYRVLLRDEIAPHLARACQLVVVRIELLVQDQKAPNLRIRERAFLREL